MADNSLQDEIEGTDDLVSRLRNLDVGAVEFPHVPNEYTNWIEEQRAWRESVALADQSHHMTELHVEGPGALDVFKDVGVNSFEPFSVGQAKQLVVCSPTGYMIGDGILFRFGSDEFLLVGGPAAPNWVEYNLMTGGYDAEAKRQGSSRFDQAVEANPNPKRFRYQIQGPDALAVMEAVTDERLPDVSFFHFESLAIDGHEVQALRHGMAGEPGFEFWGPFEHRDAVLDAVLDAGEAYGLRQLGTRTYQTTPLEVGWVPLPLPAVYGDEMEGYRRWLDAESYEGRCSLGGSYVGDDVSDYYLTPAEVGYDRLVSFDHDFVGRAALESRDASDERNLVTLEWGADDVIDVYTSLFDDSPTKKFIDLLVPRWSAVHYDEVRSGDEQVGVSKWAGYVYNARAMLSLACIDDAYSEPGTELTLRWGQPDTTANRAVERHEIADIRATVRPVPYSGDRR